jgi:hypothetical protein
MILIFISLYYNASTHSSNASLLFIILSAVFFVAFAFFVSKRIEKRIMDELNRMIQVYNGQKIDHMITIDDFNISTLFTEYNKFFIVFPSDFRLAFKVRERFFTQEIIIDPKATINDKDLIMRKVEEWLIKNENRGFQIHDISDSSGKILITLRIGTYNCDELIEFLRSTRTHLQANWIIRDNETQFEEIK